MMYERNYKDRKERDEAPSSPPPEEEDTPADKEEFAGCRLCVHTPFGVVSIDHAHDWEIDDGNLYVEHGDYEYKTAFSLRGWFCITQEELSVTR